MEVATATYSNPSYPKIWGDYDSKWTYEYDGTTETGSDKECEMWERENGEGMVTGLGSGIDIPAFKQSFYSHNYFNHQDEFINEEYYNLLFKTKSGERLLDEVYYLSGRFVLLFESACDFGIQVVGTNDSECAVSGYGCYYSNR